MKFNLDNYKGNYAMHCKTEEEANNFCDYLHEHGRKWRSGNSYSDKTCWKIYNHMAYLFNNGTWETITQCQKENYTILEWEDFMKDTFTFTKADLKTGDVIKRRDGDIEIVIKEFKSFVRSDGEYNEFYGIHDDLTSIHGTNRDIVAVRRPGYSYECVFSAFENKRGTLVYEREEVEEMTLAEVCKLLGKNIKIIK